MRWLATAIMALLFAGSATAQEAEEDAPEFLLGDLEVRVDLPRGWRMTRWSDWDFKAETSDPIMFEVWSTEVQNDPSMLEPEVWESVFREKLSEMGSADGVKLVASEVTQIQDLPVALLDFEFKLKSGTPAVLKSATLPINGQTMHLQLVALSRLKSRADAARQDLVDRLEIHTAPEKLTWSPTLEGDGFTHVLPEGWREPLPAEMAPVNKQVAAMGVERVDGCWLAMRPKGPAAPDVMVSCQGGKLLGVVDEHSFEGVEPEVRKAMFGNADLGSARRLEVDEHTAFVYDLAEKGLAVGVVPYDKGIVRTWVRGTDADASLVQALEQTLAQSTYSGAHPAGIGDQLSYWVTYRPFSPMVLGPALCLLFGGVGGVGGILFMMGRRKNKYEDLLDD